MTVEHLPYAEVSAAVEVLSQAFDTYPVMRHVLGVDPNYAAKLRVLIGLFVDNRVLRQDPLFGIRTRAGNLAAVATVTLPRDEPPPEALTVHRERIWAELGAGPRARYDAFAAAPHPFATLGPHHHLNMIGVLPTEQGHGYARELLEHVHALAEAEPASAGVSLTTETPANLPFYQRFGYRLLGHSPVAPGLETWGFFRPRDRPPVLVR